MYLSLRLKTAKLWSFLGMCFMYWQSSLSVFQGAAFRSMELWEHFSKLQKDPFNRGKRESFSLNILLGETQAISAKMKEFSLRLNPAREIISLNN